MKIGVISDTHGVVRPEVFDYLSGVEHILHAGDLGDDDVLDALSSVAPVTAVRGNVDNWPGASRLPESVDAVLSGLSIHMTHIGTPAAEWAVRLDRRPPAARPRLVISGHTHAPRRAECGGYLFLNPGSAGQRRFQLPLSLAVLDVTGEDGRFDLRIIELESGRDWTGGGG